MTIHVTPEPDGSYTVSCGNETIVVGAPHPAGAAGGGAGAISWPDDPEGNSHGVRAYLAVRPPPRNLLGAWFKTYPFDLAATWLQSEDEIAAHVQEQLLNRPASRFTDPLEVYVLAEPGKPIDIEAVMNRLNGVAENNGAKIVLYIEVGAAQVAGSGI